MHWKRDYYLEDPKPIPEMKCDYCGVKMHYIAKTNWFNANIKFCTVTCANLYTSSEDRRHSKSTRPPLSDL